MITDSIKEEITAAMRVHDELKVSTLKLLSAALHNAKIDKRAAGSEGELTKEEEIKIVQSEAKKRKDAIEALRQAQGKLTSSGAEGIEEKLEREKKELEILNEYLPKQLTDDELEEIVDKAIKSSGAESLQDMGKVMSAAMEMAAGRADGKKVAEMVKNKLT